MASVVHICDELDDDGQLVCDEMSDENFDESDGSETSEDPEKSSNISGSKATLAEED